MALLQSDKIQKVKLSFKIEKKIDETVYLLNKILKGIIQGQLDFLNFVKQICIFIEELTITNMYIKKITITKYNNIDLLCVSTVA